MPPTFTGKRALVTGAGRGIGRLTVKKLAECGCEVVALSKTKENLDTLKAEVPSIQTICVDISDWDATKKAVEDVGRIDLLVNNAGLGHVQPFGEVDANAFDSVYSVNVKAALNISQVVSNGMKQRKTGGAIVNVSSQAGTAAIKDHVVYGSSKAALDHMTRCMALELGPHQIRVNSINPTVTLTDMALVGWSDPVKANAMKSKIPMGRFCEPEHVANAILYLLSDEADMITGAIMPIDGGFTAC